MVMRTGVERRRVPEECSAGVVDLVSACMEQQAARRPGIAEVRTSSVSIKAWRHRSGGRPFFRQ